MAYPTPKTQASKKKMPQHNLSSFKKTGINGTFRISSLQYAAQTQHKSAQTLRKSAYTLRKPTQTLHKLAILITFAPDIKRT